MWMWNPAVSVLLLPRTCPKIIWLHVETGHYPGKSHVQLINEYNPYRDITNIKAKTLRDSHTCVSLQNNLNFVYYYVLSP